MRERLYIILLLLGLMFLIGCVERVNENHALQPVAVSQAEEQAMQLMAYEPERAIAMIDSARRVGIIPTLRADMLRAKVYCRTHERPRLDLAIVIGERLMANDSVRADLDLRLDVLEILLDAYRLEKDYTQALHWAGELSHIYREHSMQTDLLRNDAEMGALMVAIGQREQGLAKIDSVVRQLSGQRHYLETDVAIIALKRKAELCSRCLLFAEMIPAAKQILRLLDDYESHPADFIDGFEMSDEERPRYIDFYRCKAYAFLADGYAGIGDRSAALHYLSLFDQTDASQTFQGRFTIAPLLGQLGMTDRMLAVYDEAEQLMADDTLNLNFAEILHGRAEAAEAQARPAAAADYWRRYALLQEQLTDTLLAGKAHLFAARYHAQEQQREIDQQRAGKRVAFVITIAIALFALLILAFALYVLRLWRMAQQRNHILARQISEAAEYKEKYRLTRQQPLPLGQATDGNPPPPEAEEGGGDWSVLSDEQLYFRLHDLIEREQLFLQPDFERQTLIERTGLSKERIGAAFSQGGADGARLTTYIRELRLDYAVRLLGDQPSLTIDQVSQASGFISADTFTRNFRAKYGMTPTAYRHSMT